MDTKTLVLFIRENFNIIIFQLSTSDKVIFRYTKNDLMECKELYI